jgi:three-Cys-motif partner protein
MCIESEEQLFLQLRRSLAPFPFATANHGKFGDHIEIIEKKAKNHSVFLYVDPWTVEGLDWERMDRVFQHLSISKMSIEILLNFNAPSFVRRGLAALSLVVPESDPQIEDLEEIDAPFAAPPSIERLNLVVGGDWWQPILASPAPFPTRVQHLTDGVCARLSKRFKEVCQHPIKALPQHNVPKYFLIFASRHPHALILMNDQMVKSRKALAELAKPEHPTLFEMRPTDLVPDIEILPQVILKHISQPTKRGTVILNVIRQRFCQFARKDIRACIEQMLRNGKLQSETGKARINDKVKIFPVNKSR